MQIKLKVELKLHLYHLDVIVRCSSRGKFSFLRCERKSRIYLLLHTPTSTCNSYPYTRKRCILRSLIARNIQDVQELCIYFFRQYDVGNTRDTIIHRGHDSLTCLNIWVRRLLKTNLEQISGE